MRGPIFHFLLGFGFGLLRLIASGLGLVIVSGVPAALSFPGSASFLEKHELWKFGNSLTK